MKIKGLNINTKAIGQGIYDMIVEHGEEAIVAFGMLPSWAMNALEKQIRERIIELTAAQLDCTVEEFEPYIDEDKVRKLVNEIVHEVSIEIYNAASRAGMMVV